MGAAFYKPGFADRIISFVDENGNERSNVDFKIFMIGTAIFCGGAAK